MQTKVFPLRDYPQFVHFAALLMQHGGSFVFVADNVNTLPEDAALMFSTESFYDDSPLVVSVVSMKDKPEGLASE